MTASATAVDYATYRRRPVDVWAGADETKKTERQAAEKARLMNMMAGLAVTTLPGLPAKRRLGRNACRLFDPWEILRSGCLGDFRTCHTYGCCAAPFCGCTL